MTTKESTAVAKVPASPGTALVPTELEQMFQEQAGVGLEDMTQSDRVTPFIGLIQGLSPQIDKNKPEYIAGAEIGDTFNTVTREVYKNETGGLKVIAVLYQKIWSTWVPRDLGGGFLGSYADPDLSKPILVPNNLNDYDGPVQTVETANHFVLAQGTDGTWAPALISMTSTKLKASRNWNTLTTIAASKYKAPVFARIYTISSVSQTNEKGTFANFKIEDAGFVTPELFKMAAQFRDDIKAGLVKIDPTKAADTPAVDAEVVADEKAPKY